MDHLYQNNSIHRSSPREYEKGFFRKFSFSIGILFLLGILSVKVAFGQSNIITPETMGTVSATTLITAHETANGFVNTGLTMTNGGATGSADIRATNASTGYTGASGSANVFFAGSGTLGFAIEGIDASAFSSLQVQFGYRKESATVLPTLAFDYWDGTTYQNVAYTFSQAANAATGWYLSPLINLPVGAQINGLRLRWVKSGAQSVRIDDVKLTGISASPTINVSATSLPKFYANSGFASEGQLFTVSANNIGTNNLTISALSGYEFSTSSTFASTSSSLSFTPSSGTVATTNVYARLLSTNPNGTYGGTIVVDDASGSGATAQNIAVTGQVYEAAGSGFTQGNILTLRVGESTGSALSSASFPIFLDEYTTTGSFVQSVPMPFSVNALGTNNRRFTMSGTSSSEGYLNLSPDGQFLTFAGYDAIPGTSSITGTSAASTNRIVARIKSDASVNTTTRINDGYDANNIRSAATVDGNAFWTGGAGASNTGGVRYMTLGNTSTSTQVSTTITNSRGTAIYNSQLYATSQSASNIGVNTVGSGLPTTSGNTISVLAGTTTNSDLTNPHGFVFVDQDDNGSPDVMYVADANLGLVKFSNTSGTWTKRGSLPNPAGRAVYGITSRVSGLGRRIFLNLGTATAIATEIYSFQDNSAVTDNITSSGTDIITACGSPIITAPANVGFKGVTFTPVFVPTPTVNHTFTTPEVSVQQGNALAPLYRIQCDITDGNALLTGITVQTAGVYASSDFTSFKLVLSTDANLDGGDPVLSTISSSSGPGQTLAFTGIGQNLPVGTTRYLFIAGAVSGCATIGNSISITSTPLSAITYSNPATVKNGSPAAGTSVGITLGVLDNVSGLAASSGTPVVPVSWTNPGCVTEVIIVAHTSSITGTPTGTYTGNTNYALAPAFPGGGRVVYNGLVSPQSITGLTIGQNYFFKVFVRFGANYSSGVQVSATPQLVNLYSRGSGISHTDAIWALTPNGTPQTLAAVGGLAADRGIIIQNGHNVQLSQSGGTVLCRELIINFGGTLTATGTTTGDNKFLNLFGDVTNNGTIGTGSSTYNPICFGIEGTSVTFKGAGVFNIGRIRKNTTTPNATSTLVIDANVNILFTAGAGLYTNQDATRLNTIINNGKKLSLLAADCDLGLDGTNGLSSGERAGNLIVNGILNVGGTLFAQNNNTNPANACAITISPSGIINANNVFTDLNLGQTTQFNIVSGGKVNVSGALTVTSGTLNSNGGVRMLSNASATSRIANSAGTITGSITAERYIPSSGWHLTGTVVSGQNLPDWNDDMATFGPMPGAETPNPGYFTSSIFEYDQADNSAIPYSSVTTNGWIVPIGSAIVAGKGYRLNAQAGTTLDNTGDYTMNPAPIAVVNVPGGLYPGFNLIMNPHLSAINAAGINFGSAQNCVVIWNPSTEAYEYTGTPGSITGVTLNNSITPIASGQAFFVYTPSNTTITIPQTAKALSGGTFFRTSTSNAGVEVQLIAANGKSDAALFQFVDESQEIYEANKDVLKMRNPGLNVYTVNSQGNKLAINALPFEGSQVSIPLAYSVNASGSYKIRLLGLSNLSVDAMAYLRDNETGSIYHLDVNPEVAFTTEATEGNSSRFELIFTQSVTTVPLPKVKSDVRIFPNPAKDKFVIAQSGLEGSTRIEIRDMLGRLVQTATMYSGITEMQLNCPEVAGRYLIILHNEKIGIVNRSLLVK